MSGKTLLTLSASVLLGAAIAAPTAALAQFGPPPGPPPTLAGPPPGLGAGGPPPGLAPAVLPSVVLQPDLSLAFRPVAARAQAHLRAILPVVAISTVRPDCMVSSVADRAIFVASRVAPRPTATTRNSYGSYGYSHGFARATVTGRMRRLRLTPMADPTPPPTTAATTCPHTGDTAPGAFWSVMETD